MEYLKTNIVDKFQDPSIVYRLIEYDPNTNQTYEEHVVIYTNQYRLEPANTSEGDLEQDRIQAFLKMGFSLVTKQTYNIDIGNKKLSSQHPLKKSSKKVVKKSSKKLSKKTKKPSKKISKKTKK